MTYVLAAQRDADDCDPSALWQVYMDYIHQRAADFPPGALGLATSDWYFGATDHRAPHDAWLEWARFEEPASGRRSEERRLSLRVRLLGAYHDQYLELYYPRVYSYTMTSPDCTGGHFDWRYDEFRLAANGRLIHEIEWAGRAGIESRWLLEVSDVQFSTWPRDTAKP